MIKKRQMWIIRLAKNWQIGNITRVSYSIVTIKLSFITLDETDVAKIFKRKLIEQVNADNGELKITPQTFADIPREEQRDSKSYPREGKVRIDLTTRIFHFYRIDICSTK